MATIEIRDVLDNETGETIFPRTHVKAVIGLADSNFFEEYTDGNGVRSVRLRSEYAGLWAEGWISGAGINNGSGGGGGVSNLRELSDVYHGGGSVLRANGTPAQTGDTLVYDLTNSRWHAAPAGSGTLSPATASSLGGVKVGSVIATPTINPITSTGGRYYYLQADANGLAFVNVPWEGGGGGGGAVNSINVGETNYQPSSGVVTLPAYPTTLPASDVPSWAKQTNLQFSALPAMYALRTPIAGTAANGTLLGVDAISNGSSSTAGSDQSRIEWEPNAGGQGVGAWHFYGNVYADGWMSGAGVSGSNGGGGGVTSLYALNEVLSTTSPTNNQIFYFNGSKWTAISLKTINNNSLLGSGNINIQGGGSYSEGTGIAISNNTISISSAYQEKITKGESAYNSISALSDRVTSIESWFEIVTVNGQAALHAKSGMAIYSDSWISGAGVSGSNGGGGVTSLYDLDEVLSSTSPTTDQVFYFNGLKWTATSLKTVGGTSLIGSGNIPVSGGSSFNGGEITNDLWLHTDGDDWGSTLFFGDKNGNTGYAYIKEDSDDHLTIYGRLGVTITTGDLGSVVIEGLSVALGELSDVSLGSTITDGQALVYRSGVWSNETIQGGGSYTLPAASSSALGGIKTGYTQNAKNYPVQLDSNNRAYVSVPWEGGGGGGGTITDVTLGGTSVVSGSVAVLPAYPTTLPASDVSSWAKASTKPSYTFSEIGSKPNTLSGYGITDAKIENGTITLGSNTITPLISFTESDPTVPSWAKQSSLQFSALPNMYVGSTQVQSSKSARAFTGMSSFKATVDTNAETDSLVEWDSSAGAWHFHGNVYADGYMSGGGVGNLSSVVKYVNCANINAYNAISPKDPSTIYTVGSSPSFSKIFIGSIQIYTT